MVALVVVVHLLYVVWIVVMLMVGGVLVVLGSSPTAEVSFFFPFQTNHGKAVHIQASPVVK